MRDKFRDPNATLAKLIRSLEEGSIDAQYVVETTYTLSKAQTILWREIRDLLVKFAAEARELERDHVH